MVSFIRCPAGKICMVTGVRFAIRLAADFALFRFGAGGSTAGVGGFFYICFAILAGFPMVGLIRCPAGEGGMVIGAKFAVWFAADFALFLCGAGGGAAGVGGFLDVCVAS